MSSDNNLQEMEAGTKQSKTAVNASAKPAEGMPTMADPGTQLGNVEDLGGPTPDNYKSDDDSAKLKEPGATLKQVKDVVTKSAKPAEAMPAGMKEEEEVEGEVVAEEEATEEEVVAEEDTTEEVVEETEEEVVDYNIEEDIQAIVEGEELSEEFKEKAKVVFEAALNSKVIAIAEELEVQYNAKLEEELKIVKESLSERVDSYLEYVSEEWRNVFTVFISFIDNISIAFDSFFSKIVFCIYNDNFFLNDSSYKSFVACCVENARIEVVTKLCCI